MRIHHRFLAAGPDVVKALAEYAKVRSARAGKMLDSYVRQNRGRIKPVDVEQAKARPLRTRGESHDLARIYDDLNARYFGGGMMIAPDAKINDGFLDVINIGDIKTAKIILKAYTLYRGTHLELPEVADTLAKRIEARPQNDNDEIHIEVDGELLGKLPVTYEIKPAALKIRVPS